MKSAAVSDTIASGTIQRLRNPVTEARLSLDQLCINTIRFLSVDGVQKANSGHPGTPMALAPVVYCLWQQFLRFDPQDPIGMSSFGASVQLKDLQKSSVSPQIE